VGDREPGRNFGIAQTPLPVVRRRRGPLSHQVRGERHKCRARLSGGWESSDLIGAG
jgi:hypothetical protein